MPSHLLHTAVSSERARARERDRGSRNGWRKAYVRLHEGQSIDIAAKP